MGSDVSFPPPLAPPSLAGAGGQRVRRRDGPNAGDWFVPVGWAHQCPGHPGQCGPLICSLTAIRRLTALPGEGGGGVTVCGFDSNYREQTNNVFLNLLADCVSLKGVSVYIAMGVYIYSYALV